MFDFNFTQDKLAQIIPGNPYVSNWYDALCKILPDYEITTLPRVAAFLAECAHESINFTTLQENLNYRWESLRRVFPKYFPTDALAQQYAHNQQAIANRVYANRMGNGPEESGDGYTYSGKGLIQITGKSNYESFAESIETALEDIPSYLITFEGAVQSACWFWETNNLNSYADKQDIETVSRIINGGDNGLDDRISRYNSALQILNQ